MVHNYKTKGVCAREINIQMNEDGTIGEVEFVGGCPGNLIGIASLVKGQSPDDIIAKCKGVGCGAKPTSCPDQLSIALEQIKNLSN